MALAVDVSHVADAHGDGRRSAGVILGTAAYMSPSRRAARPVDKRTDIWAFGCVLYEMLTGRRAFEGDTVSDIARAGDRARAGLEGACPLDASAHPRLLRRCLEKDPKKRRRDIGDVRMEIEQALSGRPAAPVVDRARAIVRDSRGSSPVLAVALAVAIAWPYFRGPRRHPKRVRHQHA